MREMRFDALLQCRLSGLFHRNTLRNFVYHLRTFGKNMKDVKSSQIAAPLQKGDWREHQHECKGIKALKDKDETPSARARLMARLIGLESSRKSLQNSRQFNDLLHREKCPFYCNTCTFQIAIKLAKIRQDSLTSTTAQSSAVSSMLRQSI